MKRLTALLSVLALSLGLISSHAKAELIAYWGFNFNELPGGGFGYLADPSVFPYPADIGSGSITISGGAMTETIVNPNGDLVYRWLASQTGSTLNVVNDDISGGSLAILGGNLVNDVPVNDGAQLTFAVNMSGYQNLSISFATRRTGTGYNSQEWAYSTDGVNYTVFQTVTEFAAAGEYEAKALDTISALNNVATAYVRVTLTGITSNNGNTRFDNVQFNADEIGGGGGASVVSANVYHSTYTGATKVDTVKTVYKETNTPTFLSLDNLINSAAGIDGILLGIQDLANPAGLSASDFEFKISPTGTFNPITNPPTSWAAAPTPTVSVTEGAVDQVLITWSAANAAKDRWLRVTVKANANTGLTTPAVYYIGHLLGETTGLDGDFFTVSFSDITPIRSQIGSSAAAGNTADIDKNGTVSFADISAMRSNVGIQLSNIRVPVE